MPTLNTVQKSNTSNLASGFTLIELVVVTILLGLLSAIAMPSYLNQASKARGSEAKSNLGAINRAQQTYRFENLTFSNSVRGLDMKVNGKFYTYNVSTSSRRSAGHQSTPLLNDLKLYSSWVEQNADIYSQFICESENTGMSISSIMTTENCPSGYNPIR